MRGVYLTFGLLLLSSGPVLAQSAEPQSRIDKGPDTPAANNAYNAGGVVLQGAPGAPAPAPQATSLGTPAGQMTPGKMPSNPPPPSP